VSGAPHRDGGSATVWVIACCALVVLIGTASVERTLAVLARHRVETAADLAALAGAGRIGVDATCCAAAGRTAQDNGARLTRCSLRLGADGRTGAVSVVVRLAVHLPIVGGATVTAGARAGRVAAVP
jgi:secretion/DNA translocation related TadE-like protein